ARNDLFTTRANFVHDVPDLVINAFERARELSFFHLQPLLDSVARCPEFWIRAAHCVNHAVVKILEQHKCRQHSAKAKRTANNATQNESASLVCRHHTVAHQEYC